MLKYILFISFIIFIDNIFCQSGNRVPCAGITNVEYGGKIYHTVQIGSQCWFKENLNIGVMIKGNIEQSNNGIIEKYCYNDSLINCEKYGGLYQWDEAMQYSETEGIQGICPTGWHIPTAQEFKSLIDTIHQNSNTLLMIGQGNGYMAGTNKSGFSGLLAGSYIVKDDLYYGLGEITYWNSSTKNIQDYIFALVVGPALQSNQVFLNNGPRKTPLSVRCIKD